MAYMSFQEQLSSHSGFLLQQGLRVEEIKIGQGFLRCQAIGQNSERGELCYSTKASRLHNGLLGLVTWVRGPSGVVETHKTYGQGDSFFFGHSYSFPFRDLCTGSGGATLEQEDEEIGQKARSFWRFSDLRGCSDYLQAKRVGCYGVRFRNNSYGKVAVVPLRDSQEALWNCQLLNPNGTKRFLRGARTRGLFHTLGVPVDGLPVGVCESYVTAATCYELVGVPVAAVFTCHNLTAVSRTLQQQFPCSPVIIFADNDCHLPKNKGVEAARSVCEAIGKYGLMAVPDFGGLPVNREHTDWNDLLREAGQEVTRKMMLRVLEQAKNL